jgi:hypothetical protein
MTMAMTYPMRVRLIRCQRESMVNLIVRHFLGRCERGGAVTFALQSSASISCLTNRDCAFSKILGARCVLDASDFQRIDESGRAAEYFAVFAADATDFQT